MTTTAPPTGSLSDFEASLLAAVLAFAKEPATVMLFDAAEKDATAFLDVLFTQANSEINVLLNAHFGSLAPILSGFVDEELTSLETTLSSLLLAEISKVIPGTPGPTPTSPTPPSPGTPVPSLVVPGAK